MNNKRMVLGRTGLEITRLGFGGIPIQRVEEAEAVAVVRHALETGIDFIDTARGYTTSERRIGLALKETDRQPTIASKTMKRPADDIRAEIETSLEELQLDYIDLYQCHLVKDETDYREKVLAPGGALEGLRKAREEGLIGHIGLTTHSLDLVEPVVEDGLFDTVMLCFSFLEPKAAEKAIPKALEKNIGILAMKPFSGGVLDNSRLALKFVLSHEGVLPLAGVEFKNLIDENWAVFQGDWNLTEAELKEIEEIRGRYDKAFCRRCDYCQPCTEGIPIQMILGIRSMAKRMGPTFLPSDRVRQAVDKARNCSECELCISRCPYDLPIPDLLKTNVAWVDEQLASSRP